MLNLLANLFSREAATRSGLPASLVKMAIERAVDGTDPRLRIMSGYGKALRKPVIHAIKHVIDLVDGFPAPVAVGSKALADDPAFAALFYSEARIDQILSRDAALRDFRAANRASAASVTALLVAQRTEKRGFGSALVGDQLLSDLPRTTVSFSQHRLLAPAAEEQETRRLLKHRAFDYLLSIALLHVTQREEQRAALVRRKALLRSKMDIMRRSAGFAEPMGAENAADLQASLVDIESELSALGSTEEILPGTLAVIAEVLAQAERHFWLEDKALCLDRLYVLHDKPDSSAPLTIFKELRDSEGRQITVLLVNIEPLQIVQ